MRLALCVLATTLATAAGAQTVYRCGPDGRTYAQQPCANGTAIDAADPRTAQQRIDAQRAAAREKALADNLERDRRIQEATQRRATEAAAFQARPAATGASQAAARHIVRRRVAH